MDLQHHRSGQSPEHLVYSGNDLPGQREIGDEFIVPERNRAHLLPGIPDTIRRCIHGDRPCVLHQRP